MQRLRGEAYYLEGRARVVGPTPSGARLIVQGARPYVVLLDVEADTLLCECDCPFFQDRVAPFDTGEFDLQASKRDLADSILAAEGAPLRSLTRENLELLLS